MTPFEVLSRRGPLADRGERRHRPRAGRDRVPRRPRGARRCSGTPGADVDGERVRFPRGLCRQLVQATAPAQFTQVARNPANNVEIGGMNTVFAPAYGSPFVRDLDNGRRYGTIEDFRNFVKLTYMTPFLHHSGGTVCEPVDVPVNKRHYDMVYAHMRYSRQGRSWARSRTRAGPQDTRRDGADPLRRRLPRAEHGDRLARSTPTRRWCGTRRCSAPRRRTPRPTRPC